MDDAKGGDVREALRTLLLERAVTRGHFTLSSGATSTYYIDCREVTLSPDGLALAARLVLDSLPDDVEAVGGPPRAADPVAIGVSFLSGQGGRPLSGFMVRKEAKTHGRGRRVEGPLRQGMRVAVVEDAVTSGGSLLEAIDILEDEGLVVVAVRCLVDREAGGLERVRARGFDARALFTASDLGLH